MAQPTNKKGQRGENLAVAFLLKDNYKILERNFRYKQLEIDIIALDQDTDELVFIEVKYRKTDKYGEPVQAVSLKQLKHLETVSRIFLTQRRLEKNFRFDIISVLPKGIKHFKNITVEMS